LKKHMCTGILAVSNSRSRGGKSVGVNPDTKRYQKIQKNC
jgi:hypothetical protein